MGREKATHEEDGEDGALEGRVGRSGRPLLVHKVSVKLRRPSDDLDDPGDVHDPHILLHPGHVHLSPTVDDVAPLTEQHQDGPVEQPGHRFEDDKVGRVAEGRQGAEIGDPFFGPGGQRSDGFGDGDGELREAGVFEDREAVEEDEGGEEEDRDADHVNEDVDLVRVILACERRLVSTGVRGAEERRSGRAVEGELGLEVPDGCLGLLVGSC